MSLCVMSSWMLVSRLAAVVCAPTLDEAVSAAFSSLRAVTIGVGSWRGKNRLIPKNAMIKTAPQTMTTSSVAPARFAASTVGSLNSPVTPRSSTATRRASAAPGRP